MKIDVPTVFACKWLTVTEVVETVVWVDLDKVLETDDLDVETVVWVDLDEVLEADDLDVEIVVRVELVGVVKAVEVNVETEPFVFEYIQLW